MTLRFIIFAIISLQLRVHLQAANDYKGENLSMILGVNATSLEFKAFTESWKLDNNFESSGGGLKLYINKSNNHVESILVAGENLKIGNTYFSKCSSVLPFEISLNDNAAVLKEKLGEGHKHADKNLMKFYKGTVAIEILFADLNASKIKVLKLYSKPVVAFSAFRTAILDVFNAYRDSNFYSIKGSDRVSNNFWKYKFTYSTKLKIPGEQFNMLYSFPFTSSPLDFVSILKEADTYDASFEAVYKDFEKKLMQNFPQSDGWIAACIPNKESKTLSDLEFRNDRYGAVVLDYSKNPNGKHILYMRFLLFSS